jgi:hypothetical protein
VTTLIPGGQDSTCRQGLRLSKAFVEGRRNCLQIVIFYGPRIDLMNRQLPACAMMKATSGKSSSEKPAFFATSILRW